MSRHRSPSSDQTARNARLRDLLFDCVDSAPAEQADRIREAQALLQRSSTSAQHSLASQPDQKIIEAMLGLGAYESAVLALVGGDTAFMISRGANGNCLASAVLPDGSEELVAEGSTLALALLIAFLSSLLADGDEATGESADFPANAGLRLN
ncbi:MAG: hypothetical protein P8J20_17695 [Novosphingobium sp.]|nr:hypothetical protein [Novosphingobium sp.]